MIKTNKEVDEKVRQSVEEAIQLHVNDKDLSEALLNSVMEKIEATCGAAAIRRRTVSDLRAAFKDGFMLGKVSGKFARWHSQLWSQSQTALNLKDPANDAGHMQERYARYNFD